MKREKFLILPKISRAGAGIQSDELRIEIAILQSGVIATQPVPIVIAPSVVSILPSISEFTARVTAPPCENKVPFTILFSAISTAPSASQKTLAALVPLVKVIVEPASAVNAPKNLIINTASGSPPPSRVTSPAKDPALPIE